MSDFKLLLIIVGIPSLLIGLLLYIGINNTIPSEKIILDMANFSTNCEESKIIAEKELIEGKGFVVDACGKKIKYIYHNAD